LAQEQERIELLQEITAAANENDSVEEALQIALDLICEYTEWPLAHVFMPDHREDGNVVLSSSGIWHCDDCEENESFTFFQKVTEETTFTSGEGWLGRVFAEGTPAWSVDVLEEPDFARNHHLEGLNVRAGFAFPVLVGEQVVAVLEFYATEAVDLDEELLEIMANIGTQLGRVVEREWAAKQIEKSRDFYLELFENFPLLIWRADKDGECDYFNQTWLAFTGRRLDEELENGWLESVHPDDRERRRETFQTSVAERRPFTLEYRLQRHDGVYRWVRDHGQPFSDAAGSHAGFIGACTDITEQVEATAQLKQREMLLAEAQSVARLGSWELDLAAGKMRATEHIYEILGVAPETFEMTPTRLLALVHPDDRGAARQILDDSAQRTAPWDVYLRIIRPDDEIRYLHIRNKPLQNESGEAHRIIGIAQDVTEQRKLELELERSLAFLAEAQRLAQVGNWEYDLETEESVFSDQIYHIYGLDPETDTITLDKLFEMVHPQDRLASRRVLRTVRKEKQADTSRVRTLLPGGEVRYVEAYTEPVLDESGEVRKLRGTVQDITEREESEEKIRKQVRQLSFLHKLGQTVVSTLDLDTVLERSLETLRTLLDAEGVFVLLRTGDEALYFAAADHIGDKDLTGVRVSLERGVAGEAIRSEKPQWVTGDQAQERVFEQVEQLDHHTTRSIIAIPLNVWNRTIGVVEAIHSDSTAFAEDDVTTLAAAAPWIAIAIENARLYREVETGRRRYRELAEELVWAQEEERRRISRDLHDDVGQGMVALALQLDQIQHMVDGEAAQEKLEDAGALIDSITERLRTLAYNLRPPELDTLGLHAALSSLCQKYENRPNLPEIYFVGEKLPRQVPDGIVLSFYRFLQEALTNVLKHAAASRVEVKLTYNGEVIRLHVADNGRGFDDNPDNLEAISGLGLLGMQERFATLNGSLEIRSRQGQGTEIVASIPW
jgi:PAS domain S-box-containing protein